MDGNGQHLGAAGRTVEDPIRQAAHLRMTTVTRVFTKSPGKRDYLHKRLHYGVVESTLTEVALDQTREKAPRRL
jgi:hypothetical protein